MIRLTIHVLVLSILLPLTSLAAQNTEPVKLPDTAAGRLVAAYIKAFNTGDEKVYREFVIEHIAKSALQQVPTEERLKRYREIYSAFGGYEVRRVLDAGQNSIKVVAKTKKAGTVELIFELETEPPHGLLSLRVERAEGPESDKPGATPSGATVVRAQGQEQPSAANTSRSATVEVQPDAAAKIDEYLTRLAPFGFSGAVLVARDDRVLFNKAYGFADRAKGLPNTTETLFDTGSVGKQFTGAAIFKLESLGKLNTADSISKYLDNVPTDKQAVTIDQLLRHRSGVTPSQSFRAGDDFSDRDRRVRQILEAPLVFEPGTRYQYSNAGYNLLAAIIEKASGQSYQQFMYENLFKPAGMTSTAFQTGRFAVPGIEQKTVARLYTGTHDNGTPRGRENFAWFFTGPGGILTTPGDLYRWHRALVGDRVLPPAAKKKYYELAQVEGTMRDTPRGKVISHGGGTTMGTGAQFVRYLDTGIVIAACINNSGEEFNDVVTRNLTAAVFGGDLRLPPVVTRMPADSMGKFAGTYALATGGTLTARVSDGQLWLSAADAKGLAALFGAQPSERYRKLEERTAAIIGDYVKGDYAQLQQAFITPADANRLATREQKTWQEWQSKHGAFKSFAIIGTTPEPMDDAAVNVRFDFERGAIVAQYVWFPRGLDGVRILDAAPGISFLPAGGAEFVNYRLLTGEIVRVKFATDNSAKVTGLTLSGRGQEASAARLK